MRRLIELLRHGKTSGHVTKGVLCLGMPFEIAFLGAARRVGGRAVRDVIDYRFGVTDGRSAAAVTVGITGAYHDRAPGLGIKELSLVRVEAATSWLRSRLERGLCKPFRSINPDAAIDLPSDVMDYWIENRSLPHWF